MLFLPSAKIRVINNLMKKYILIFFTFYFSGCATKPAIPQSQNEEYEVVRLALSQFKKISSKEFRLIEKPGNLFIVDYFDGSRYELLGVPSLIFSFNNNPASAWDKKILGKTVADKKVVIIKDFATIPKAPLHEDEKAEIYFSISNPIFSDDGQYVLINVTSFYNHELSPTNSDIMIFRKINGQWVYQNKFAAAFY